MFKQFLLQSGKADAAASYFDIINLDIINDGTRYCNNLTVSALFRVGLLFAWRRLCQGQGTCTQSKMLVHINLPSVKKSAK